MAHDPQRQIAAYFRKGGRLTVKRAWDMFGTTELRRIVSRLRKGGMDIVSRWVSVETRDGRQQRVKEYSIQDAKPLWWIRVANVFSSNLNYNNLRTHGR